MATKFDQCLNKGLKCSPRCKSSESDAYSVSLTLAVGEFELEDVASCDSL